ncbi:ABC transporter permease [Microtetraspora sp. NBRC 13810]|uniref:ABC transporter permease n=1 Tax=Microtetraspora sp. NBRC 13810 TaxID=3030990 RepID=UPI0024A43751|nr:ABC transporter permease [Microtetraspora sp. NBRC 13810]GLW12737.1 ABC transporter permease [Microtetraspora sp. NBRC 13810]
MGFVLYIGRRLLAAVPVLFGTTLIVFFMIHLVPGDPAVTLLGTHATPQAVAALHAQMGLDQPVWRQYLDFLGRLLHGDLGHSFFYQSSVTSLILGRISATLWLILAGAIFAVLVSVPLAVWAASRRGGLADHVIRTVPLLGLGMPAFWLGIMLILLFALKLGLFPVSGYGTTFAQHVQGIILPGLTVALALTPILVRSLRTSMINVLGSDYITTARAKGIGAGRTIAGHALRNAAVSSVTVLGVNIAYLVGSTLVVERVFSLPGVGTQMIDAIFNRDFPVVQGVTMFFAVMVVAVNLLTDVAHAGLDPRVRLS